MPEISVSGFLNDTPYDFEKLFDVWRKVNDTSDNVTFKFLGCRFLAQNALAVLGGLKRLAELQDRKVYFDWTGIQSNVYRHLENNGFLHELTGEGNANLVKDTAVPFRIDMHAKKDEYIEYLRERWLSQNRLDMEAPLKEAIITTVIEAYLNVFDHAASPIGVATCGQHFPNTRQLKITMVDFGVGIPHNVRIYLNQPTLTADRAILWAFQPGSTTKRNDVRNISRGLGLKELKRFVQRNDGRLEIYSEDGYVCVDRRGEHANKRPGSFGGTVVQITLICDWQHYALEDDELQDDDPLF